jgi:hypothetical protein
VGQEYFINSQELQNKVANLLPSQGGAGAGFDLSASTQIVPIIDLTESAEGSNVRVDLQTALSHKTITAFQVSNASDTVLVNNTGYYRVFGNNVMGGNAGSSFNLFDGASAKDIIVFASYASGAQVTDNFDFIVKLEAGSSLRVTSNNSSSIISGSTRQIADIDGNLTSP